MNKPCFVTMRIALLSIIYLPSCDGHCSSFYSRSNIPLPNFRFLTYGVYRVSLLFFNNTRFCGTLWKYHLIHENELRLILVVSFWARLYLLNLRKRYRHYSLCEHGLSSTIFHSSDWLQTSFKFDLIIILLNIIHTFLFCTKNYYCFSNPDLLTNLNSQDLFYVPNLYLKISIWNQW